jgi:hypothetical protein
MSVSITSPITRRINPASRDGASLDIVLKTVPIKYPPRMTRTSPTNPVISSISCKRLSRSHQQGCSTTYISLFITSRLQAISIFFPHSFLHSSRCTIFSMSKNIRSVYKKKRRTGGIRGTHSAEPTAASRPSGVRSSRASTCVEKTS